MQADRLRIDVDVVAVNTPNHACFKPAERAIHDFIDIAEHGSRLSTVDERPVSVVAAISKVLKPTDETAFERSVFDDLATFVSEYSNDVADLAGNLGQQEKIKEYFTVEVVGQQLLSEDYGFCKLCNDVTIPIHVAPWVQLTHTGTFCFEGRLPSGE